MSEHKLTLRELLTARDASGREMDPPVFVARTDAQAAEFRRLFRGYRCVRLDGSRYDDEGWETES